MKDCPSYVQDEGYLSFIGYPSENDYLEIVKMSKDMNEVNEIV